MTCQHCTAELPPFALFCGECGRSVSAPVIVPSAPIPPLHAETPRGDGVEATPATPSVDSLIVVCAVCAARGEPDDVYCAECGSLMPADTRVIDRLQAVEPAVIVSTPQSPPRPPTAAPSAPPSPPSAPPSAPPSPPSAPTLVDVESTRIVTRSTGGARFVLQFSTGESYTVLGSGLAGRNPRPEPGEYVDHLVTIVDRGRSVSKTHFEFGQHEGMFWFSDRHSGNGSTIREPGSEPRVCEPGRRYPIVRGTRVDIGEQFVIVS